MKKEIPILFSTMMVQAILEGRKTQTRRIVKQLPPDVEIQYFFEKEGKHYSKQGINGAAELGFRCPYGQPGDLLWVRESFVSGYKMKEGVFVLNKEGEYIPKNWYKADGDLHQWWTGDSDFPVENIPWKPSIHMPKAAARIWLEVTKVRVERLQEISQSDCVSEGIQQLLMSRMQLASAGSVRWRNYLKEPELFNEAVKPYESFQSLWISINGPESWNANPWVWVVEYKVLSKTGKPEIT